jgi:hypothetical protein
VWCEWRGEVKIVGLTDAEIPWPIGQKGSSRSLVIYGSLAQAVRNESNQAVAHWWGITGQTVTKWRRALGVEPITKGTSRLLSDCAREEPIVQARKKAHAKARDPERRRKIAESRRGKKRPRHVIEAVRAANLGRKLSAEHWAKMSAAHKQRGTIPPKAEGRWWTPEEDELVRTLTAAEAAERTGRTLPAIYMRRSKLGVPDARRR